MPRPVPHGVTTSLVLFATLLGLTAAQYYLAACGLDAACTVCGGTLRSPMRVWQCGLYNEFNTYVYAQIQPTGAPGEFLLVHGCPDLTCASCPLQYTLLLNACTTVSDTNHWAMSTTPHGVRAVGCPLRLSASLTLVALVAGCE